MVKVVIPRIHCQNCRSDKTWPTVGKIKLDTKRYSIMCPDCKEFLRIVETPEYNLFERAYGPLPQERPIVAQPPTPDMNTIDLNGNQISGSNNNSSVVTIDVETPYVSSEKQVIKHIVKVAETPVETTKEQKLSQIEEAQKQIVEQMKRLEELKNSLK